MQILTIVSQLPMVVRAVTAAQAGVPGGEAMCSPGMQLAALPCACKCLCDGRATTEPPGVRHSEPIPLLITHGCTARWLNLSIYGTS